MAFIKSNYRNKHARILQQNGDKPAPGFCREMYGGEDVLPAYLSRSAFQVLHCCPR